MTITSSTLNWPCGNEWKGTLLIYSHDFLSYSDTSSKALLIFVLIIHHLGVIIHISLPDESSSHGFHQFNEDWCNEICCKLFYAFVKLILTTASMINFTDLMLYCKIGKVEKSYVPMSLRVSLKNLLIGFACLGNQKHTQIYLV